MATNCGKARGGSVSLFRTYTEGEGVHVRLPPTRTKWLRSVLIALASLEACYTVLQSLEVMAPAAQIANGHFAAQITTALLIAAPIFAVAALAFAALDRLPQAIMALSAVVLTTWASELVSAHLTGIALVLAHVVPVIAVLAIILAVRNIWLGVAAALVASMWLSWFWATFLSGVLPFVVGVMIYGA